ncbi:FAD/NAD(P)-binding domain-containing protein [Amniculicola lignicola CBS 123094]|uniref:FAD/NAD(P)-binding domain-containing protein n=1 Tax=Amniculicola lignicola CBS 123094 TaxID=1392246 RepID=A0A6A5WHI3_9PLEO|nr:FAD/NAD(P)-binding domain-containing protein [Amniculicola lignicola CBS 123094]
MPNTRNIVILGGSVSGLGAAHYTLNHLLPLLNAKHEAKYHVYLVNPSSEWYFRIAAPRTAASTSRLPAEKLFFSIPDRFKQYPASDFTFVQGTATSLDTTSRKVTISRSEYLDDEIIEYHALIVATGTKTYHSALSQNGDSSETLTAIKTLNAQVSSAKNIIIVGGGAVGVEAAGEIGEHLNSKPGWFSTPTKKVSITLITAASQLLPTLRPAIGKQAEAQLKRLGVDVVYNTRVIDTETAGAKTIVTLAKGEKLEADLYIPAQGVTPNSSFLPPSLLTDTGYLKTLDTLRVDSSLAGPRVYGYGDVASYSRNTVVDVYDAFPTLIVNLQRDLLAFPNEKPKGKDRVYVKEMREMMVVPIGSGGGVGAVFGYKLPSWAVWLIKGRDFFAGMAGGTVEGAKVKKVIKLSAEESVVYLEDHLTAHNPITLDPLRREETKTIPASMTSATVSIAGNTLVPHSTAERAVLYKNIYKTAQEKKIASYVNRKMMLLYDATGAQPKLQERAMKTARAHESAFTEYSHAEILALTEAMRRTLPREVRDLVYDHLFNEKACSDLFAWMTAQQGAPGWKCRSEEEGPPPILKPQVVGLEIVREAAQAFYKNWTAMIEESEAEYAKPEMILNLDYFGCGVIPMDHVRRVDVNFYRQKSRGGGEKAWSEFLAPLFSLPFQKKVSIRFDMTSGFDRTPSLLVALEPVFDKLVALGADLEITYCHEQEPLPNGDHWYPTTDMEDVLKLPPDQRKGKWKEICGKYRM